MTIDTSDVTTCSEFGNGSTSAAVGGLVGFFVG